MQLGVTATYCSSCWRDKELRALDRGEIIGTLILCGTKAQIKVIFDPKTYNFLLVLQDNLDHLTNCNFRGHLRLIFAL